MIKKPFYERIKPLLYLLPFIVSVSVFTLYPIVNVIRMSFLEGYKYLSGAYTGVGLGNYEKVLSDPFFRQAISNTFRYVLLVVPISTVIAIVLATLLNQKIKFRESFRPFAPSVTEERAADFFDSDAVSPYMLLTTKVREELCSRSEGRETDIYKIAGKSIRKRLIHNKMPLFVFNIYRLLYFVHLDHSGR